METSPPKVEPLKLTYCVNELSRHTWRYRVRRYGSNTRADHLALVFETEKNDYRELLRVMQDPHVEQVIEAKHRWFVQHPGKIVVGTFPVFEALSKHLASTPRGGVGYTCGGFCENHRVWTYQELADRCVLLDRITNNCELCTISAAECMSERLGVPTFTERTKLEDLQDEDNLSPRGNAVAAFIKHAFRDSKWEYVSPRACSGDAFGTRIQPINSIDFKEVVTSRHRDAERARNAANTRAALRRCKSECMFYEYCGAVAKPYYGLPVRCQQEKGEANGPYRTASILEALHWFLERSGLGGRTQEDVALIALNAGLETRLPDGCIWVLERFAPDFRGVEFSSRRATLVHTFSWDETLRLLHTPYRTGNEYVYPTVQKPSRLMREDELMIYIELCQMQSIYSGRGGGWGRQDADVHDIGWSPDCGFYINDSLCNRYNTIHISSYPELKARLRPWSCPQVLREFLEVSSP